MGTDVEQNAPPMISSSEDDLKNLENAFASLQDQAQAVFQAMAKIITGMEVLILFSYDHCWC